MAHEAKVSPVDFSYRHAEPMDVRAAVRQALVIQSANEELGELVIEEYVVFLLALDTYLRYVEETSGKEDHADEVAHKGLRLLRMADSDADSIQAFLDEHLPTQTHKRMLARAMSMSVTTPAGASRRALQIRTLLSRGGPATMRAIFKNNRAIRGIREAMTASMMDDADAALDRFAALPMKNVRLRDWIDKAAATAGSGELSQTPLESGANDLSSDHTDSLVRDSLEQIAPAGADTAKKAQDTRSTTLVSIEEGARDAAKKNLEITKKPDEPLTRSEVVGVAVAAAAAAMSDTSKPQNVAEPLRALDDEQRAAAMTDGKVLVAAGAGSGKSTTLVARVAYLVKDRRVFPGRILVTSFNKKAADELGTKIGRAVGGEAAQQMSIGTMHALFGRFIGEYGTNAEKIAFGRGGRSAPNGFIKDGKKVAYAVQRIWAECFDTDDHPVPKLKNVLKLKTLWAGNSVSPAEAKVAAKDEEEVEAARWYEMYEGLKGSIPGWRPPCGNSRSFEGFMAKSRPGGIRLGDFDDMLQVFHDILKRDPGVRKTVQKMYDHILVDEAQDRNKVQAEIIDMMSEHIGDGSDGKSLWIVGDDKQAIYTFRGARPDLFTALDDKEDWKTRTIRTNYRCPPEVVDFANRLIAHNEGQIPMEALPNPARSRGVSSIRVEAPDDDAQAAISTIEEIKANLEMPGSNISDNGILCRTNKELHAFETACIIRGIPYARKAGGSFLGSPETSTFLGYVQLVTGDNYEKQQKSLGMVINRPNRFFVSADRGTKAVEDALSAYARQTGQDIKTVSPMAALQDQDFVYSLAQKLTGLNRGFKFDKAIEKLNDLADSLSAMQASSSDPDYSTADMFDDILNLRGMVGEVDPATGRARFVEQSFRDSLQVTMRDQVTDEDEPDEDEDETKGLGNIAFLYELAKPDPTEPEELETPPTSPHGFKAKIERYAAKVRDLRIDINKWGKEQEKLPPEQRTPPPGVYLGTVHSVKGAMWKNTYVQMPRGKFPFEPVVKPGQPPPDPEEMQAEREAERRLAYVAMTRAASSLTILCPASIGGKAAGVSPFVAEAGLAIGENVPKPNAETGEIPPEAPVQKEAAEDDYDGIVPDDWSEPVEMKWP